MQRYATICRDSAGSAAPANLPVPSVRYFSTSYVMQLPNQDDRLTKIEIRDSAKIITDH